MSKQETIESLGLLPHYDLFINGEFVPSTDPNAKCTSKSPVDEQFFQHLQMPQKKT